MSEVKPQIEMYPLRVSVTVARVEIEALPDNTHRIKLDGQEIHCVSGVELTWTENELWKLKLETYPQALVLNSKSKEQIDRAKWARIKEKQNKETDG